MNPLYRLLDKIFDKPPKGLDDAGKVLCCQAENESYRRYKHLCYRNLVLDAAVSFLCGAVIRWCFRWHPSHAGVPFPPRPHPTEKRRRD